MSKTINQRILIKSDTSANWHTASTKGFKPLAGEFISYSDRKHHNIKLGDNEHTPDELDWISAQPDWNQNDETKVDYIKNRTHYEYEGYIIDHLLMDTEPYSQILPAALKPGKIYKFILDCDDGQVYEYSFEATETNSYEYERTLEFDALGINGSIKVLIEQNEITITKIHIPADNLYFSLYGLMIKQLDAQYLPIALHAGEGEASIVQNDGSEYILDDSNYNSTSPSNWTNATHAVVFGNNNRIYETTIGNDVNGKNSFIGGGLLNIIHSGNSAITGGRDNTIGTSDVFKGFSAIAGGHTNSVYSSYSFIGGGRGNVIDVDSSFASITGGQSHNILNASYSAIVGGYNSDLSNVKSFIGGGEGHTLSGEKSAIVGGYNNTSLAANDFIGGGRSNTVYLEHSVIVGGNKNTVGQEGSAKIYSGIVAGNQNKLNGDNCVISGGYKNQINAGYGFIGGGRDNIINQSYSGIIGGQSVVIDSLYSFASGLGIEISSQGGTGFGKYNLTKDAAFVIGNGTSKTARKDAFKVNWDGTVTAGKNPINSMDLTTKQYVDDLIQKLEERIVKLEVGNGYTLTFSTIPDRIDIWSAGYQVAIDDKDINEYFDDGITTFKNLKTFKINGGGFVLKATGSNPDKEYTEDELFTVETLSGDEWYNRADKIVEDGWFEGVYKFTLLQDCTITYLREYDGENWDWEEPS